MVSKNDVLFEFVTVDSALLGLKKRVLLSVDKFGRPVVQLPNSELYVTTSELIELYQQKCATVDALREFIQEKYDRRCSNHYVPKKKKKVAPCMG